MVAHIRIGDMLVAAGFITEANVEEALLRQRESGRRLGAELLELGFLSEVQFTQVLSNQLSIPWVSLNHVQFTRELLNLIPAKLAQEHVVVPIYIRHVRRAGDTLFVAMQDPTDESALAAVVEATGMPVKAMVAPPTEIQNAIRVYYLGARARRASEMAPPPSERRAPAGASEPATAPTAREPGEEAPPEAAPAEELGEVAEESQASGSEPTTGAASADEDEAWSEDAKPASKPPAASGPRMITLTLLDGTTVRLPAPGGGARAQAAEEESASSLTAVDLVRALQARAKGEDVGHVLPDDRWELLFSTLLTLLIKKGLVADWEFVEEWERQRGD